MMKKYVIYGLGMSGISAINYFSKKEHEVIATDDNESSIINAKNKLSHAKVTFLKVDKINFDENTIIIFSPGIPLYFPKPHKILEIVKETKAKLVCDIEAFFQENRQNNFIGITGTNGKSTTTSLVGFILKSLEINSEIGGNIGVPCFDLPQDIKKTYIFETSSYQLDLVDKIRFKIAALLNITRDHIERHGSIENYILSKKRIFLNQTKSDFSLINIDNHNSRLLFEELKNNHNFKAKLIPISTSKSLKDGISLIDGKLSYFNNPSLNLKSEFLKGDHNNQNMAFAFAISYLTRPNLANQIIESIKKFKGLKHRLQIVDEIEGIKFINDSKATNAESVKHALKSFDNIFWIVGGKSKEDGIEDLKPFFNKITKAYLIGDASNEFSEIFKQYEVNFEECGDLDKAFKKSLFDAKNDSLYKKNILLSPACASFDQWKNFEERGDYFCKLINELQNHKND